jgi:hypothetical protein
MTFKSLAVCTASLRGFFCSRGRPSSVSSIPAGIKKFRNESNAYYGYNNIYGPRPKHMNCLIWEETNKASAGKMGHVKIAAQEAPVTLAASCLLALHVIPYGSVGLGTALSVVGLESDWQRFPPLGRPYSHASRRYVNFDGFVVLANPQASGQYAAYAQVFRSGIVEVVSTIERRNGAIFASDIDKYCVGSARAYIDILAKFGVGYPIAVVASLLGMKGRSIESGIDNLYPPYGEQQIDRDQLHFTECIVESTAANYAECAASLRRLLEQIWNVAGFADQQTIAANGVWQFGAP